MALAITGNVPTTVRSTFLYDARTGGLPVVMAVVVVTLVVTLVRGP